ncbi:sidestep VII transmembrane protein isoform X2 [Rhodnius prolixus]
MVIVDENGVEKNNFAGPYEEGADLSLRCRVFGGKPRPTVAWYRGEELLTNFSSPGLSAGDPLTESMLVIHSLGRADLRSELTCTASNYNKTLPLTSTVHVDMNFKPLDVRILASSQPLSVGRRYDLMCQSTGSRPPAKVTWWKNGHRLERTKETTSNDGNTTTSTLSFVASKDDDGKNLSCRAENPITSSEVLQDYWTLHIHYVPETSIHLGTSLNPDSIREGTDVYFDCNVKAEPNVYKVEWRHNGHILNHNVGQGVIISNQSLVLQGVSRQSAGEYTCVGFNTEGDGESKPFYLNVMYAPTCKPNQTRVHGVAKQERANISCEVDSNPSEVTFRWTFNNSADSIEVEPGRIVRHGSSSVVTYTPMSELDYGTLLCWATNRIGHQKVPCVYHIIAAGRPDQVHNCTVANTSMTSFSIRCSEGFNGGLPQSFTIEVREPGTETLAANLSSPVPRFTVLGLQPGLIYHAYIYSVNVKGHSDPIIIYAPTLRLPEKQLTADRGGERPRNGFRLTPVMTVVVGVVSSLFVVACLVAAVLRLQCSREDDPRRSKPEVPPAKPPGSSPKGDLSSETDERNPDIIPQPNSGLEEEEHEFMRKRQLVSTIETTRTSPTRSLLQPGPYTGYCTLRNGGLPLQDLSNIPTTKPPQVGEVGMFAGGGCTLPRHWGGVPPTARTPYQTVVPIRGVPVLPPEPAPHVPMAAAGAGTDPSPQTPLMANKRESQV